MVSSSYSIIILQNDIYNEFNQLPIILRREGIHLYIASITRANHNTYTITSIFVNIVISGKDRKQGFPMNSDVRKL